MDRKSIKAEAKEKIKGNIWKILWPMILINLVSNFLTNMLDRIFNIPSANEILASESLDILSSVSPIYYVLSFILTIAVTAFVAAYVKYLLNFVRTGEASFSDIVDCVKEKWLKIILASILIEVVVFVFTLLLIVPGIIRAFAYTFALTILVDDDVEAKESLKKSREMMKGYKWDYFVFTLSFFGWYLLIIPTLGLIFIYLIPFLRVSEILYYEKLKQLQQ